MSDELVKLFDKAELSGPSDQASAVARATQEIQAALVVAQRFPRDEVKAKSRILEACKRKELAEEAEYEYARGGTRITGPTIDLLRAVANRWGNLRFGWNEVERRDGQSALRCFAWDLQSHTQAERTFIVRHWRDTQAGGYALKDERDIYEALANQASRRVRACLVEVIDSDIVTAAVEACRITLRRGETVPLADRAVQMVGAFAEHGVTQGMIEERLGNNLASVSENQLASLRRVYKSLKDGVGVREDYFKRRVTEPEFSAATAAEARAKKQGPEPPAEKESVAGDENREYKLVYRDELHPGAKPGVSGGENRQDDLKPAESAPAVKRSGARTAKAPASAPIPKLEPKSSALDELRAKCAAANLAEARLLEFFHEWGCTKGEVSTLDELAESEHYKGLVDWSLKDWAAVMTAVQEAQ